MATLSVCENLTLVIKMGACSGKPLYIKQQVSSSNIANPKLYDMRNKRGRMIIFNHEHFDTMKRRKGTEYDEKDLRIIFKSFGYKVKLYKNLNCCDLMKKIKKASEYDYSKYDSLAIAVLTHGSEDKLYAKDIQYACEKLWEPFANVESLKGKPKLFFVQACRGEKKEHGIKYESPMDNQINNRNNIPNEDNSVMFSHQNFSHPDFLIVYSTMLGYFSYRSKTCGSWFIQVLVDVLDKDWKELDIEGMIVKVSREITVKKSRKYRETGAKAVPCLVSTLTKCLKLEQKKVKKR